jgi:fructose-bisphosphate aldolase class II
MIKNLTDLLTPAYKQRYAVGAFNVYNYETVKGVIAYAAETNTPLIIAFGEKYLKNMSLPTVKAIVDGLTSGLEIDICLHLDHCSSLENICRAIQAGFTSVMYDGSMLSFEKNLKNTKKVCDIAHACDISVEAELGSLASGAHSHEGSAADIEKYTVPALAKEFIDYTKADALAVSVGTVHGLYKGEANIRIDILEEINRLLGIPLVLHGDSGLSAGIIKKCISNGISKININTELSIHVVENTKKLLNQNTMHYSQLSLTQIDFVKEIVEKYTTLFQGARQ